VSEVLLGWLLLFALAGSVVIVAGIILARSGDEIALRTGLGGLLVGLLLLSVATSLPELATDVAASVQGNPDIAVGDLFGSSMANMAILAIIEIAARGRLWPGVSIGQARIAAIAIALTAVALLGIVAPAGIVVGWVGIETIVIVIAYAAAAAWVGRTAGSGRQAMEAIPELVAPTGWASQEEARHGLRAVIGQFVGAAIAVLLAAPILALSADGIATETGSSQTAIGVALVAVSTSLPELVASLAAVRIGAFDLAVGNLFGSNAFNMTILFASDVAYTPGAILSDVSPSQAIASTGAIVLMAVAVAAVVHGSRTRRLSLEPGAALLLIIYVVILAMLFERSA
jgi:cation:H+ antiporter